MALSGSVATNKYDSVIGLLLTWTATQSQVDNQSTIKWTLKSDGSNPASYWVTGNVTVVIDGQTVLRIASSFQLLGGGAWSRSGTIVLDHNEEGEKDFDVSITAGIYAYNSSNTTGSGSFTLNQILRESSVGATDANIGAVSAIAVNRKSEAFTHSIKYAFGSLSGYITAAGGVSSSEVKFSDINIAFTVPTSFYAQMPNAKTGVCTLTITTYYGSTKIGSAKTAEFMVTAAQSTCAPEVSGTVVDSNDATIALTGTKNKLVRYYSNALCTITATAKNSASIAQKKIGGTTVSGTTRTILAVEVDAVTFETTDSRGYSAAADVDFELVPYVKLTSNPAGQRTDPTSGNATLSLRGNFYNGSFGAVSNALTVKYRIAQVGGSYGDYVTVTPTLSGNTYSAEVSLSGLNYEYAFRVEVVTTDKLATVTKYITIKQGIPVFDWGEKDFRFNVPVDFAGGVSASMISLGEYTGDLGSITDLQLNSVVWVTPSTVNNPYSNYGLCETWGSHTGGTVRIQRITYTNRTVCMRIRYNGAWTEWEWDNPPMALGTEYRLTKRFAGSVVYAKYVNIGTLPNASTVSVAHGITGYARFLEAKIFARTGASGQHMVFDYGGSNVHVLISGSNISITVPSLNFSSFSGYAYLEYTKG